MYKTNITQKSKGCAPNVQFISFHFYSNVRKRQFRFENAKNHNEWPDIGRNKTTENTKMLNEQ